MGRTERLHLEGSEKETLLESSQALRPRNFDNVSMKVKSWWYRTMTIVTLLKMLLLHRTRGLITITNANVLVSDFCLWRQYTRRWFFFCVVTP